MGSTRTGCQLVLSAVITASVSASVVRADAVTDWDRNACQIVAAARLGAPVEYRALAIVGTAVYEAVNAITGRYPPTSLELQAAPDASVPAAVAAVNRVTLSTLVPSQQAAIDRAYSAAMAAVPEGSSRANGIAIGEKAARAVLGMRSDDGASWHESYRPFTSPGVYVPTVIPAAPQWPQRRPWNMSSAEQLRPGPPPALSTSQWARDFNEIKALGARTSPSRTAEQTAIARFWEATEAGLYHGLAQSVAGTSGREITQNARLFAAVSQAADDALIAVFDAKYHYGFWRPITAIRNGDADGNDATERDPSWASLIDTPMHPEYPCAHCSLSGAVGTVLRLEVGDGPTPTLATTSSTAGGAMRSWSRIEDFMEEVANARIYDGVHYRTSTEVGTALGKQVGELAALKYLRPGSQGRITASARH